MNGCFVGLCTVDLQYLVDDFPRPNQKIQAAQQELTAGGPATNAAVTFSFLGGQATLITAIGGHSLASLAWGDLKNHRVAVRDLAANPSTPPPLSSICIHRRSGERTVVSANASAQAAPLAGFKAETLQGMNILLVDGHHMPLCIAAAKAARQMGIDVVLDAGSWKEGMSDLLPYVQVAICSDDFTPKRGEEVAGFLRDRGVPSVAITRGARTILWHSGKVQGEVPVRMIHTLDTSGAGDILHGAFCWAYAHGTEFSKALEFASEVATESCLFYGTRAWMNPDAYRKFTKLL